MIKIKHFLETVEPDDGSGVQFVHGSPRDPTREYVFPTDVLNPEKIYGIFEHVERVAFNGHTHAPGVMTESGLFKLPQDGDNEPDNQMTYKDAVNLLDLGVDLMIGNRFSEPKRLRSTEKAAGRVA